MKQNPGFVFISAKEKAGLGEVCENIIEYYIAVAIKMINLGLGECTTRGRMVLPYK